MSRMSNQIVIIHSDSLAKLKAKHGIWEEFESEINHHPDTKLLLDSSIYLDTKDGYDIYKKYSGKYLGIMSGGRGLYPNKIGFVNYTDRTLDSEFIFVADSSIEKIIGEGPLIVPTYQMVDVENVQNSEELNIRLMWEKVPENDIYRIDDAINRVRHTLFSAHPDWFPQSFLDEVVHERYNNSVVINNAQAMMASPIAFATFLAVFFREIILLFRVNMTRFEEPGRPVILLAGSR